MVDIAIIDKNFAVPRRVQRTDIVYYDIEQEPFRIYGIHKENGKFRRMPQEEAQKVSQHIVNLHICTAGGRVRFVTDSPYIAIHAELNHVESMPHMTLCGSAGFDLYTRENGKEYFQGTFRPTYDANHCYESLIELTERKERMYTVNFPLYSGVSKLYIGLQRDATLKRAEDYTYEKPIVSYGSSTTQGGCATRPGNSYQSILGRWLDCNYINLGFSGNAKGEDEMVDYLCGLAMHAFIMDYDYNAPTPEHLRYTHEKMYLAIRKVQPMLPIIMLTRPKYYVTPWDKEFLEVIRTTYKHAIENGDKNIYLIEGTELMKEVKDDGTVDGVHPTDAGFFSIARAIAPMLKKILET